MLYDNAQLASLYLHAWLATDNATYRRVTEETLDYLLAEMRHPSGGFFSAQDADSEGVEGKFFVWSPDEIRSVLGDDSMARAVLRYWGVSDGPNFEGQSILFVPHASDGVAAALGISADRLSELVARARQRLYAARDTRAPGLDDKVLASWNGLALSASRRPAAPGATGLRCRRGGQWPVPHDIHDGRRAPDAPWKDGGSDPGLSRGLRDGRRRARVALRGHLRPALAG
jgi:uncharacterized protein YyaL (SSP411 family)